MKTQRLIALAKMAEAKACPTCPRSSEGFSDPQKAEKGNPNSRLPEASGCLSVEPVGEGVQSVAARANVGDRV